MRRLAEQLFLLRAAYDSFDEGEPRDALLLIEGGQASRVSGEESVRLFQAIVAMYQRWASTRRMHQQLLADGTQRVIMAISGFRAYRILIHETGLHVWEIPTSDHSSARYQVTVRVAPQPDEPRYDDRSRREQAEHILANMEQHTLSAVRRYRETPSPLVRDKVDGWRTGRLDRVLDGDFDLL
jgi:ATP-dependent Clp protease ATP-binding subunit ClpC